MIAPSPPQIAADKTLFITVRERKACPAMSDSIDK